MRSWLPALGVTLLVGCGTQLDPAYALREAAKRMSFTLERIQPGLDLRVPLDRSSLRLEAVLGLDNPTDTRLDVRGVRGTLTLEVDGQSHRIGDLVSVGRIQAAPKARGTVNLSITLAYADLKASWEPLSRAVLQRKPATWRYEGRVSVDLLGLPLDLPFRTLKEANR